MSENNVLLWGVRWTDSIGEVHWLGDQYPGGVLTWSQDNIKYAQQVALEHQNAVVMPYLTFEQVMDAFMDAKAEAMKGASPMQKRLLDAVFKLGGLGG